MPAIPTIRTNVLQEPRFVVRVEKAPGVAMSAKFMSVEGLQASVGVSTIWHGGSMIAQKDPCRVTYPPVTLTRGRTKDAELYNWFAVAVAPVPANVGEEFRIVEIVEQDRARRTINRWRLYNAFVSEYNPGNFNNDSDDYRMESVVIEYEFFEAIGLTGTIGISHLAGALG